MVDALGKSCSRMSLLEMAVVLLLNDNPVVTLNASRVIIACNLK